MRAVAVPSQSSEDTVRPRPLRDTGRLEDRVANHDGVDEPNRIAVLAASAGATVALGAFGHMLTEKTRSMQVMLPTPDGDEKPDRIVQFGHALDNDPNAIEAAYRVLTWGLIADLGAFFWRPNYELEMYECAQAFEFRNSYEGQVPAFGEPVSTDPSDEERGKLLAELLKGTLFCMISAAIDEPVEFESDPIVGMHIPQWTELFLDARQVANERINELAPQGLPIWKNTD